MAFFTTTQTLLALWRQARTRFSDQLPALTEEDLTKKLPGTQNSVGFLIRHIGEVEMLFVKNVFGEHVQVKAKTLIAQHDTGEWTDLAELLSFVSQSAVALESVISKQTDQDWQREIVTREFGRKTLAESLGRIISHTAHHGGQMAVILKYAAAQPLVAREMKLDTEP
ncbi:DinB family protein [Dyadobacter jiangsuensis]|uniref:Putative damage-inducible protein DinB n=1 Tax=Dyadobacter jiangsuensis TaxID=1591085 RepID=A0A2P8GCA5_9BACT|nr:DinB family protein [Dyadobacter jiangsuensis]PSL31596.1 putative damage-inducible protein DinB [Dyadobacter jiangsuensis]